MAARKAATDAQPPRLTRGFTLVEIAVVPIVAPVPARVTVVVPLAGAANQPGELPRYDRVFVVVPEWVCWTRCRSVSM